MLIVVFCRYSLVAAGDGGNCVLAFKHVAASTLQLPLAKENLRIFAMQQSHERKQQQLQQQPI